jgi:hypothetical protein
MFHGTASPYGCLGHLANVRRALVSVDMGWVDVCPDFYILADASVSVSKSESGPRIHVSDTLPECVLRIRDRQPKRIVWWGGVATAVVVVLVWAVDAVVVGVVTAVQPPGAAAGRTHTGLMPGETRGCLCDLWAIVR